MTVKKNNVRIAFHYFIKICQTAFQQLLYFHVWTKADRRAMPSTTRLEFLDVFLPVLAALSIAVVLFSSLLICAIAILAKLANRKWKKQKTKAEVKFKKWLSDSGASQFYHEIKQHDFEEPTDLETWPNRPEDPMFVDPLTGKVYDASGKHCTTDECKQWVKATALSEGEAGKTRSPKT